MLTPNYPTRLFSVTIGLVLILGCTTSIAPSPAPSEEVSSVQAANLPELKAKLGELLFHDTNLSEPAGVSCASCHDPKRAFVGNNDSPDPAVAQGSRPGQLGARNSPTLTYLSFSPSFYFEKEEEVGADGAVEVGHIPTGGFFWDGRAKTLEAQAKSPFLATHEMNNKDIPSLIAKVASSHYADLFRQVFGEDALNHPMQAFEFVAEAIAAFERTDTFHPFSSKFDAYLRGELVLTDQEEEGLALFINPEKGNCLACHVGDPDSRDPKDWLFTDFTYDNLGFPRNPAISKTRDASYFDLGLCNKPGLSDIAPKALDPETLCGAFKVPTLRNSAVTAPYGHNGVFMGLRMVVLFYATRDTNPSRWYTKRPDGSLNKFDDLPRTYMPNVNVDEVPYGQKVGQEPRLNDAEIDALVAFLETLTDKEFKPSF